MKRTRHKTMGPCLPYRKILLVALMLLLGFCPATVPSVVARASDAQQEAPADQAEAVIAPDNVATRATEVSNLIAELTTQFASLPEVDDIREKFSIARQTITTEIDDAQSALQGTATIEALQDLQARWKPRQVQIGGWLDQLTKKAIALQDALSRLDKLLRLWTRTQVSLRASASETAEDFAAPGEKRDGIEKNGNPP
jgi:hypothetical protein